MEEPIRVAQIIGMATAGGVESIILNLYKNIDRHQIQFDFFVESESILINKEEIEKMGGRVIIIPSYKHLFKYEKELKRLFIEGEYKIVHSNMNTLSVFTLRAAKKAGIKARIAHSHSTASMKEVLRSTLKYMLRPFSKVYANCYLACSQKAGEFQFGKRTFKKGEVRIIPNGIDVARFSFDIEKRNKVRHQYGINDDEILLGHVGRFVTVKNHDFIVRLFAKYNSINPKSKLMLVGDGPLREEIKSLAKTLNVDDKIIFVDPVSDTSPFYSAFDLFLLPSLYEGLGLVGIEAEASGLPCLFSTNVPEEAKLIDIVKYLPLEDKEDKWAKEILNIDFNIDRKSYGKELLNSKFNIKHSATEMLTIYKELLEKYYGL